MVTSAEQIKDPTHARVASASILLAMAVSETVARQIESHLRNDGHPIRCAWVADLETLESALHAKTPDLLIVSSGLQAAPLSDVVGISRRLMPDLPILLLASQASMSDRIAAMNAGAVDVVSDEDEEHMDHLKLVVLRELKRHSDLRALRNTQQRLETFESRHRQLVTDTNDAVAHIQEGILTGVNPAFSHMLGYSNPDALEGMPLMDVVSGEHQPRVKDFIKLLYRGRNDGKSLECALLHEDGHPVPIKARMSMAIVDGEHQIEMLIRSEAMVGAVPGADQEKAREANRIAFLEDLSASMAAAAKGPSKYAAMLFVVNDFAGTEHRLGLHDATEAVDQLQQWLRGQLMDCDKVYRFSTHEVAALVMRDEGADIISLGETIATAVTEQIFSTTGHEANLSLTVAAYPYTGSENPSAMASELVRDTRQHSAPGPSQFFNLGPTAKSSLEERAQSQMADRVRKAIEADRLRLAYQSIASLEGDSRQHYDVLVRVVDEDNQELHASEFVPACERFNLMEVIDRWVTARALKLQAQREDGDELPSLFVKLSEETLRDTEGFISWLGEQLAQRKLRPGELVFELREQVVQNHIRKAKLLTRSLAELGVQVAIEHFGQGANSMQFIEQIPIHYLKFHPTFTSNFNDAEIQRKMAGLMEAAKQKHIKIIVSHVEDANVMARLWQMGVNFIQGYSVQEPEVVLLSAEVSR